MKLSLETPQDLNLITSYDASHVAINRQRFEASLVVLPDHTAPHWGPSRYADLASEHFAQIVQLSPELVLLGTGVRQRFPAPQLLRPLIDAGIGWEVMDLGSACRTYNLLASEGRRVAAALLLEPA